MLTPQRVLTQAVRGQYGPGKIGANTVPGYRSEADVTPDSSTETFAALKLFLDNWRWLHVPFYLRTGKRMSARQSEITIQFKSGPATLFKSIGNKIKHNVLRIKIQPEEGISLSFNAKLPNQPLEVGQVDMTFKYSDYFGIKSQTGYETILYECMNGDHLLFNTAEMVERSWALVEPVMAVWAAIPPSEFPNYAAGTNGPKESDELLEQDGRRWLI
jgi:glucose-6-phosphate 1-dehydrogenase